MAGVRVWAGGVVVAAAVAAGCNDPGPPKRELAKPVDEGKSETPPPSKAKLTKPDKTDPAAEAVVEKLLNAHTGGKPELIDRLTSVKSVRKGRFETAGPTVWTVRAVWPDRFRQDYELARLGGRAEVMGLGAAGAWKLLASQGMTEPAPQSAAELTAFLPDILAEWVPLLVPLAEKAGRVAVPVPPPADDPKAGPGFRVWVGDRPPVVVRIDPGTGLLDRVEYESPDRSGGGVPLVLRVHDRKPTNGVLLPTRTSYTANRNPASSWDSAEYEFPARFPPETFEKP